MNFSGPLLILELSRWEMIIFDWYSKNLITKQAISMGKTELNRTFNLDSSHAVIKMYYSRGLSEAFPDIKENTRHSPCSWVTHMESGKSGRRREIQGKSYSVRISTYENGGSTLVIRAQEGDQGDSENSLQRRQSWKGSLKMAWVGRQDCWKGITNRWPSSKIQGSNERWKWWEVDR